MSNYYIHLSVKVTAGWIGIATGFTLFFSALPLAHSLKTLPFLDIGHTQNKIAAHVVNIFEYIGRFILVMGAYCASIILFESSPALSSIEVVQLAFQSMLPYLVGGSALLVSSLMIRHTVFGTCA